jgi:hypothetical protein
MELVVRKTDLLRELQLFQGIAIGRTLIRFSRTCCWKPTARSEDAGDRSRVGLRRNMATCRRADQRAAGKEAEIVKALPKPTSALRKTRAA